MDELSSLAEYWCTWKEDNICGYLSRILLESTDDMSLQKKLSTLVPDLKESIETASSMTTWMVSDLLAYQLLSWMATGGKAMDGSPLHAMIRSLMPMILEEYSRHSSSPMFVWRCSFGYYEDARYNFRCRSPSSDNRVGRAFPFPAHLLLVCKTMEVHAL